MPWIKRSEVDLVRPSLRGDRKDVRIRQPCSSLGHDEAKGTDRACWLLAERQSVRIDQSLAAFSPYGLSEMNGPNANKTYAHLPGIAGILVGSDPSQPREKWSLVGWAGSFTS